MEYKVCRVCGLVETDDMTIDVINSEGMLVERIAPKEGQKINLYSEKYRINPLTCEHKFMDLMNNAAARLLGVGKR